MIKEDLITKEEFERLNNMSYHRVITSEFIDGDEVYPPHNIGKCCLGNNPLTEYKAIAKSRGKDIMVWIHMSSESISKVLFDSDSYIQLWIDKNGEIDYSHIYHEEN